MMSSVAPDNSLSEDCGANLAVITVVFHPGSGCLERQAAALPSSALWILVDNGCSAVELARLEALVAQRRTAVLLRNGANIGLAAALNRGAQHVVDTQPLREMLLFLDQDSAPHDGAIGELLRGFDDLERTGISVGCVGPRLVDAATGLQHGFHCIRDWRWVRLFPGPRDKPIACANINGSGTLMRTALFRRLGGLDEQFFIDHVDTEWSFRVLNAGFGLYGIPAATFDHAMGERGLGFWWFGWRVWPQRPPTRHYYLFRNAVALLRRGYVPIVWKVWAVAKLVLTLSAHALLDPRRRAQVSCMLRGARSGLRMASSGPSTSARAWSKGALVRVGACPACGLVDDGFEQMECRDHRGDMAMDCWTMRRCAACESLYLDPKPDDTSLAAAYGSYYTHVAELEVVPSSGARRIAWRMIHGYLNAAFGMARNPALAIGSPLFALLPPWRLKLDYYARHLFIRHFPARGALLDVGCGNGAFLLRAKEMGWNVSGLDPDPKAVAACKSQGLDVIEGTLANCPRAYDGRFDVLSLSHSIEHVPDPGAALAAAALMLREGGTLWMALPNPHGFGSRYFRGDWRELHPPYHLCIPSQSQLSRLLDVAGFDDIRFLKRGAHARRMMRESADNAKARGSMRLRCKAMTAPVLRAFSDFVATLGSHWGEETVVVAKRRMRA